MWKQDNQYKSVTEHSTGTKRRLGAKKMRGSCMGPSPCGVPHPVYWMKMEKQGHWNGVIWLPNSM